MALPGSGQISMSQVRAELGLGGQFSMSAARGLFGVPSGSLSMSQGYGKAAGPVIYRPTAWTADTGVANSAFAVDGSITTYSFTSSSSIFQNFYGFPSVTIPSYVGVTPRIAAHLIPGEDEGGIQAMQLRYLYSWDGFTWTEFGGLVSTDSPTQFDEFESISWISGAGRNLSNLRIVFQSSCGAAGGYDGNAELKVYDMKIHVE